MDDWKMTVAFPDGTTSEPVALGDLKMARDTFEKARDAGGRARLKSDPDFDAASEKAYRMTAAELRQFVERFERLEAERLEIVDLQKEVMAEAKGRGYDTRILRLIIRERKRDKDEMAEERAILDLYREALGMR